MSLFFFPFLFCKQKAAWRLPHTSGSLGDYWVILQEVLSTFALGTAVGDLTATTFGLGYFTAGLLVRHLR